MAKKIDLPVVGRVGLGTAAALGAVAVAGSLVVAPAVARAAGLDNLGLGSLGKSEDEDEDEPTYRIGPRGNRSAVGEVKTPSNPSSGSPSSSDEDEPGAWRRFWRGVWGGIKDLASSEAAKEFASEAATQAFNPDGGADADAAVDALDAL